VTDDDINALARQWQAYTDCKAMTLRGQDIVLFARALLAAQRVEIRNEHLDQIRAALGGGE
jgi:hypothetical protein